MLLDLLARLGLFIRQMLQQNHSVGDRFWKAMLEGNMGKDWVSKLYEEVNFPQAVVFSLQTPARVKYNVESDSKR